MTFIADLRPCSYLSDSARVLAVGWLSGDAAVARGDVDDSLFAKLMKLLVEPWQPLAIAGYHDCEFCRFSGSSKRLTHGGITVEYGATNLFVPGEDVVYAAPSMIVHYIDSHGYAPPSVFRDAVMSCPPMQSMDYKRAMLKSAPPGFMTGRTAH